MDRDSRWLGIIRLVIPHVESKTYTAHQVEWLGKYLFCCQTVWTRWHHVEIVQQHLGPYGYVAHLPSTVLLHVLSQPARTDILPGLAWRRPLSRQCIMNLPTWSPCWICSQLNKKVCYHKPIRRRHSWSTK